MGFYDKHILPRIIDFACGQDVMKEQRRLVTPLAHGRVLEVGIGSGHNLPFYDATKVERVIGIDPGAELLALARERSHGLPFPVDLLPHGCETMPLEDASMDTVLVTFALCTIPGVEQALTQMRRVLKPGGNLIFCEHGRSPDAGVQRWQNRLNPLWKRCLGGCNLNRDMPTLIRDSGFALDRLETEYLKNVPRFAGYRYLGIASAI
jgi:ubiquinone/menaquinone biosynthesis C-methylase UbiE